MSKMERTPNSLLWLTTTGMFARMRRLFNRCCHKKAPGDVLRRLGGKPDHPCLYPMNGFTMPHSSTDSAQCASFRYGQLPSSVTFLRVYKDLSNAETCYLNWVITHRDRSKPGIQSLPILDKTVAAAYGYSIFTIGDARWHLSKRGFLDVENGAKGYRCSIPTHWYHDAEMKDAIRDLKERLVSEDDLNTSVTLTSGHQSSSLNMSEEEQFANPRAPRLPAVAEAAHTESFTEEFTESSSLELSDQDVANDENGEEEDSDVKVNRGKAACDLVLSAWYNYGGFRRSDDEDTVTKLLARIMDRTNVGGCYREISNR